MPRFRSPETRRDDRQPVDRNAVEAAAIDLPRQHRLLAHRLGFAVHDAAAGEHFGGPRFDVVAGERMPLPPASSGGTAKRDHDRRR